MERERYGYDSTRTGSNEKKTDIPVELDDHPGTAWHRLSGFLFCDRFPRPQVVVKPL